MHVVAVGQAGFEGKVKPMSYGGKAKACRRAKSTGYGDQQKGHNGVGSEKSSMPPSPRRGSSIRGGEECSEPELPAPSLPSPIATITTTIPAPQREESRDNRRSGSSPDDTRDNGGSGISVGGDIRGSSQLVPPSLTTCGVTTDDRSQFDTVVEEHGVFVTGGDCCDKPFRTPYSPGRAPAKNRLKDDVTARSNSDGDVSEEQSETNENPSENPPSRNSDSPPRPILAGPATTEVMATIGGDRGEGSCAIATRTKLGDTGGLRGTTTPITTATAAPTSTSPTKTTPTSSLTPTPSSASSPPSRRVERVAPAVTVAQRTTRRTVVAATSNNKEEILPSAASLPEELLRTLIGIDARGSKGRDDNKSARFKEAVHQRGVSETAGSRRQDRVREMEEAKGLVSGMDGVAALALAPFLEELLVVALRLTEDADFKIVRSCNGMLCECIVSMRRNTYRFTETLGTIGVALSR